MPVTIAAVGAGVGVASKGAELYMSYQARKDAERKLKRLGQNPENFSATPELTNYYTTATNDAQNAIGFLPSQKAAFDADLAKRNATIMYNAKGAAGGNLSKYLTPYLATSNGSSLNDFYAKDAEFMTRNRQAGRSRQGMAVNQFQNINDRNVDARNRRKELLAGILGQSISQQNQNIAGAYGDFANLGFTAAGYGLAGMAGAPPGGAKPAASGYVQPPTGEAAWNFSNTSTPPTQYEQVQKYRGF